MLYDNTAERLESAARMIAAHASEAAGLEVLVRAIEEMLADNWTLGLVPGMTGEGVNLPFTSPKAAFARSNARVERLAGALADAFPDELDRITAYALVGAVLGAASAIVVASLGEGRTEEQVLDAARNACRLAVAGFHPADLRNRGEPVRSQSAVLGHAHRREAFGGEDNRGKSVDGWLIRPRRSYNSGQGAPGRLVGTGLTVRKVIDAAASLGSGTR